MQRPICALVIGSALCAALTLSAAIRYVNLDNPTPAAPFTSWATAATNIQDAVDVAMAGDEIVVTNGVYATGGRVVYGMSNRVAVTKPVKLRSVNGPEVTSIVGFGPNGPDAVRCVYLTNGAMLVGFTLANGATQTSGDLDRNQSGGGVWSESAGVVVSNCVLTGNSASWYGGGAECATLYNCTLTGNWAHLGGGADCSTLYNCALTGNRARMGGGANVGRLYNCTLTGNWAEWGGGANDSTLNNCIVYYNTARDGANYQNGTLNYCCTTPLPPTGIGNIDAEPQLASLSHISATSPCRGAGSATYASGLDIDGEPWATPPSIGCDEYWSEWGTGALSVAIKVNYTNVAVGFAVDFEALIGGRVSGSEWNFGDGVVVSNQPCVTHSWSEAGDYTVELRAYNETYPGGVSATVTVQVVEQPVHYVALDSTDPLPPYGSWATAARNIQEAVDAATVPGALVLVSNGVYQIGGRVVYGISNRVAVTKPVTLCSVNGPEVTVIRGYQVPGTTNGDEAVRCVYLTNGAMLVGFTLANGATQTSGDHHRNRSGGGVWCESASAVVSNCVLTGNSADNGGGGGYGGTLYNCTLTHNWARWYGGGAEYGTLYNCTLTGNWAHLGGGASGGVLYNCTLTGNRAGWGGGASGGALYNCTLTGNLADEDGGGAHSCRLNNCILYYNTAPTGGNYSDSTLNYCCATPLPPEGVGNIDTEPQLASVSHISVTSPCLSAGSAAYAAGLDIDGEPWGNPPSIGCDEHWSGWATGALSVAIKVNYTNVAVGFAVDFEALIGGRVSVSRWDFGDGVVLGNRPYATHSWSVAGNYTVELRAYNETYPRGVSATVTVQVVDQPVHYVALDSPGPVWPYNSWATAARDIQEAVDAATVPGALVLVSNGVYAIGGRAVYGTSNRVAVTKPVRLRSVNGPEVTSIVGAGPNGPDAVRCVYLTNGAMLVGFTLTNGATQTSGDHYNNRSGGGVWCESTSAVISNCVLTGNSADDSGGGAFGGTLYNCTLTSNSSSYGGGAYRCTLCNCTLSGNSAGDLAGGAYRGTVNNCIVYYNTAPIGANYDGGTLNYCCTTPLPPEGVGNIEAEPLFVDTNGWSNLRLKPNSPCINSGNNAYVLSDTDLDGKPRIAGGTVDIGAYEFRFPDMFRGWLQQYGLPTDGSADYVDSDLDGHKNWQEWVAGTNPTDSTSVLRMLSATCGVSGVTVSWTSVAGRRYVLECATDLGAAPGFWVLQGNISGEPGMTSWTDTNAVGSGPRFYRVRVQE